jgi:hypothetical protein
VRRFREGEASETLVRFTPGRARRCSARTALLGAHGAARRARRCSARTALLGAYPGAVPGAALGAVVAVGVAAWWLRAMSETAPGDPAAAGSTASR